MTPVVVRCGHCAPGIVTSILIILNPCSKDKLCGGAADSSWNITQPQNIKAFIKYINKVKRLVACIDQMISDVKPINDV